MNNYESSNPDLLLSSLLEKAANTKAAITKYETAIADLAALSSSSPEHSGSFDTAIEACNELIRLNRFILETDLITIIHVIDDIVIDADKYQFIVGQLKTRTDKDGNEQQFISNPHYCGKQMSYALQTALEIVMLRNVSENRITELKDYAERIKELHDLLQRSIGLLKEQEKFIQE